jgi:hypothetical protein
MKTDSTTLAPIGILVVPALLFGGVYVLCDSILGLNYPIPLIAAVGTLFAFLGAGVWWLSRQQRLEDLIVGSIEHPYFGAIIQKRDSWEAESSVPGLGVDLHIVGDMGNEPTANQQETVEWMTATAPQIIGELEAALDAFSRESRKLPPRPRQFVVESLRLEPIRPKTFFLDFDLKDAELPWGFSANYVDGALKELRDCHCAKILTFQTGPTS